MGMILKENNRLKIGNENPESLAAVHTKKKVF